MLFGLFLILSRNNLTHSPSTRPMKFVTNETHFNQDKSIAVLPFVNMSADPDNEYFSDGISEEIINALTKVRGLKVIARTSSFAFKGKNEDIRSIGQQLGVTSVLEGSVRKSNNKVRVTAQLINTKDGTHFWSRNFDRNVDDIFVMQDEISLLIADQIRENFGHFDIQDQLFESHTNNVEAYQSFLKGRFYQLKWNIDSFKQAIEFYKRSITLDSTYPLPFCGMVQCYTSLFLWNAITKDEAIALTDDCLKKLAQISPKLPEYHLAHASCAIILDWDFKLAHSELKTTLSLNPRNTDALESLAGLYILIGAFEEGIREIDKALQIDPLSANHTFMKGNIYYFAGEYQKAIYWMDHALDINPKMLLATQVKLASLLLLNRQQEFKALAKLNQQFPFSKYFQHLGMLMQGQRDIPPLDGDFTNEFQPWALYFAIYSGKTDKAFRLLRNGLDQQIGQYITFRFDPLVKPLREKEPFQTLSADYKNFFFDLKKELDQSATSVAPKLDAEEQETYRKALYQLMENDQPYLDPALSLKSLADQLDIHANKLSWLINVCEAQNFNEFVNHYRIETFKKVALDPANAHLTLLGLAYESGFNSKTVFNTFFKKTEGVTPSKWVKSARLK